MKNFILSAKISSDNVQAIKPVLAGLFQKTSIKMDGDDFLIETTMQGETAKELNKNLLSALRKAEKKTRLRSEWKSGGMIEKFFDYVPKGVKKAE